MTGYSRSGEALDPKDVPWFIGSRAERENNIKNDNNQMGIYIIY